MILLIAFIAALFGGDIDICFLILLHWAMSI